MVKWIPGGKNLYQILVTANNFDSRRHRIILRVNGKFYDNLKNYFTQNVILLPDSVTKKSALALPTEDLTIYAQLYDYQNNDIICTKKQEFGSMLLMWKERGRLENTVSDRFNFFWHKNKKVAKVEGPFDKEGKLQTEVKPGERYYFKALPNQQLHHTELLSVKWVYQYDGGEYSFFENHRIATISGYNMMNTIFKNGPKKTKVYAYFVEKSERVMVEFSNAVQAEEAAEKQEEQQKEQDKPVTATGDICEFEARVRAFMRMLRYKEGTSNESGYTKLFSGKKFTDMRKHPEKVINAGGYKSSAAGAYQIMADTWKDLRGYFYDKEKDKWEYNKKKDYAKLYNIKSFDQESQDKFCLAIMKHGYTVDRPKGFYNPKIYIDKNKEKYDEKAERKAREWRKRFKGQQGDIIEMIIKGDIKRASLISSLCWSSLPDSPYGQQDPKYTFKDVKAIYEKYLKEELAGQSKELHLKKGFLKEFGYNDCGDLPKVKTQSTKTEGSKIEPAKIQQVSENNGKWRNPIDNPMLCLYSQGGGDKPWHGSFGKKIRDNIKDHSGNDLLAVPGTKVYACVKSKVVRISTSSTLAGKTVVLKVLDERTFKGLKRKDYTPKYKSKGEILSRGFDENKPIYLVFWHLSKNDFFKEGEIVEHNAVIGLTGISGENGVNFSTRNPHLHFEVNNVGSSPGLEGKCNPSVYFKFKTADQLSKSEIDFQNKLKEKEWK